MNRIAKKIIVAALAGLSGSAAMAEIAVVVDPSVTMDSVSIEQLERLYLNKASRVAGSDKLTPVDHPKGSALRKEFAEKVLGKTERELASYWSRLMFSGKGRPPRQYSDDAEVIEQVTANPGTIGYIDAASVTGETKVLLRIP